MKNGAALPRGPFWPKENLYSGLLIQKNANPKQ